MKYTILFLAIFMSIGSSRGQVWETVGNGLNDHVHDLIKFNNMLYAAGRMGVQYWDGSTWTSLPSIWGIAYPLTLAVLDDTLYAGGDYPWAGSISKVHKFNGAEWTQVGGDFDDALWSSTKRLLTYDGQLISGGQYTSVNGSSISNIAIWNGTTWNSLGDGLNGGVWHLAEHNGQLFASGDFTSSGTDTTICRIAKWDGTSWSSLDTTHIFNSYGPMFSFNNDLMIGNVFDTISGIPMKGILKWTGSSYTSMGNDLIKSVSDIWTFNDEVYLSGKIHNLNPNDDDDVVLKWNGFFWQQIGQNFNAPVLPIDDFNGDLYCAGFFTTSGTTPTPHIARFNMTTHISALDSKDEFGVFPNPTADTFVFRTPRHGRLMVLNQHGQLMKTVIIKDTHTYIDTDDLCSGIYFLTFRSDIDQTTLKLIKN